MVSNYIRRVEWPGPYLLGILQHDVDILQHDVDIKSETEHRIGGIQSAESGARLGVLKVP
jgi:hypothetical protein